MKTQKGLSLAAKTDQPDSIQPSFFDSVLTVIFHNYSTGQTVTWVCPTADDLRSALDRLSGLDHCKVINHGNSHVHRAD